jgi:hypothetical protein
LTLGGYDAWEAASAVWQARLTDTERAALSWAALRSLDHDDAMKVAETVLGGAGAPLPPFLNPVDEAAFWASCASPQELDSYALACTRAMAPGRRTAFLDYMNERAAA